MRFGRSADPAADYRPRHFPINFNARIAKSATDPAAVSPQRTYRDFQITVINIVFKFRAKRFADFAKKTVPRD